MESSSPSKWTPDEIRRFYRAFHKYGADFQKVSKMVGGGKAPEMCTSLWRRHQAYLSLDKKFQSEVAFVALVQDGGAVQEAPPVDDLGRSPAAPRLRAVSGADGLSGDDEDEILASIPRPGRIKHEEEEEEDAAAEAAAAAAMEAMSSPEKSLGGMGGGGGGAAGPVVDGLTLAATRARRTPKRSPAQRAPPPSSGKRRGRGGDDDIYEYYDEGVTSESARKRRQTRQRLTFDAAAAAAAAAGAAPVPGRREEKGGIDALLALAVAGADTDGEAAEPRPSAAGGGQRDPRPAPPRYLDDDEEEPDDEDVLGVGVDDDKDEDFTMGRQRGRRTPHTTPAKARGGRPGSGAGTPHRSGSRALSSPGLRSPGWGMESDFLGGDYGGGDMSFLSSPGLPGGLLPPGFVASPQNPMPRLRRRKAPPERGVPPLISPLKTLFGRRQLANSQLLAMGSVFSGAAAEEEVPLNASATEVRARHALGPRLRKFCANEWFYSAIDRSWYMDWTMTDLAAHAGIPPGTRLTRNEWSALRSGLGRPRRLSWAFLRESRAALEAHRRASRDTAAAAMPDTALVAALPRPLAVGQRVVARHPLTRQLHDGSILTTAAESYRVQFNRRELGVEVVRDIDVAAAEPWENLPMNIMASRPRMSVGGRLVVNGRATEPVRFVGDSGGVGGGQGGPPPPPLPDPAVMAELATHLDRKEALLVQLRGMNEEATAGQHTDPATGRPTATFTQAYTSVALKLAEVNELLAGKLAELEAAGGGATAAGLAEELAAGGGRLPRELLEGPITVDTLFEAAEREAARAAATCRARVGAGRVEVLAGREAPRGGDAHLLDGAVAPLVDGAALTLALLQLGSDRLVPAQAMADALDASVRRVKPKSVVNAALYTEIEAAINALKLQLLA